MRHVTNEFPLHDFLTFMAVIPIAQICETGVQIVNYTSDDMSHAYLEEQTCRGAKKGEARITAQRP